MFRACLGVSRRKAILSMVSALWFVLAPAPAMSALGGDWPQYLYDAGRTAASPQSLPDALQLLWVRELPTPRPAFPEGNQICYDATYEPVVMGKTMFVPSMVTDSVTALDTETGKQIWQFFAEGPVRLAPAAGQGKVYFVSDDGYLYCVGAADGKLLWKFRGLPAGREDRKVMGNQRLVSIFPARGGPVLADGIVYFAAGIWSDEGVFVHALDAETGKAVWSNTDSGKLANANADHGVGGVAGISPQGHLAIVNATLVVPCGSHLPALMDAGTGRLYTYTMGWGGKFQQPKGSVFVSGIGKYLFHTGDLYDVSTAGKGPSWNDPNRDFGGIRMQMIHVAGLPRIQVDPTNVKKGLGDFRKPVLTAEAMYYSQEGVGIAAFDLTRPDLRKNAGAKGGENRKAAKGGDDDDDGGGGSDKRFADPESVVFPELWRLASESKVHIKAGGRLYCGWSGAVEAVDIPPAGGQARVSWQAGVQGQPYRMLAADDKLFVVTLEGRIYAFAGGKPGQAAVHKAPVPPAASGQGAASAGAILGAAAVRDGYVLMLGPDEPGLAEGFVSRSKCDVIVIEPDAAKAAALRERFQQAGLYGSRIAVLTDDWASVRLPPYFASLIVLGGAEAARAKDPALLQSLFRSLRPYGGACVGLAPAAMQSVSGMLSSGRLQGGALVRKGEFSMLVRQGPLDGSADWSHEYANAANTGSSKDESVRPPLKRLWFDGSGRWMKRMVAVRIAGGRLLICADEMYAIDAYTGRHLWQSEQSAGDKTVALEDAIYVPGRSCAVFDPATGKRVGEINLGGGGKSFCSAIRVSGEIMVASSGQRLVCLSRKTGRILWEHSCANSIGSLAVGGGKVFCSDGANRRRTGPEAGAAAGSVTALDVRDGRLLWKAPMAGELLYSEPHDVVVVGAELPRGQEGHPRFNSAYALKKFTACRASDGRALWSDVVGTHAFIVGQKLIAYLTQDTPKHALVTVHDLLTGRKLADDIEWYQRGCTVLRAGSTLLTTRYLGNAAYYDLSSGKMTPISNVRAACINNLYPADGLLVLPNLSIGCFCNYLPVSQGFVPSPDSP